MQIAGQRKWLITIAGILSALSALCMLVPYWSVYIVIEELLINAHNPANTGYERIINAGWTALYGLIAGLALLYCSLMASHIAAFRTLYGLRVRLSEHIGRLPLGYLSNTSTGTIKKTMEQNIEKIETFIAHTIPDIINVMATIVFMFVIFFTLDGWLAAVSLACIIAGIALQYANFMGSKARRFTAKYFDTQEEMSASAVQYVRGMPVVKIFGQSIKSFRSFFREIINYKKWALKICDTYEPGMVSFTVILNSIITLIIPTGLLLIDGNAGSMAFAAVWLFFIIMGPGVTSPVYKLMFLGGGTREIDEGVRRLDNILAEQPLPEPEHPQTPSTYGIEFRNVSFSYENKRQATRTKALCNVDFEVPQGSLTAIVGPSGSGKSTVASLIPRFWDADEGEILIGGVKIKEIASDKLMDIVAFVFQDTFLFYDTIYENIAAGKKDCSLKEVEEAARAAQCHDFITALPDGYFTIIGNGGTMLSGGEAQRICVARAILKNAPILVLDEATAFADPENEQKMQKALQNLIKGKTVIMIAHRLTSIASARQIIVMDNGTVVQKGTHINLIAEPGLYRNMWEAYADAYNWKLTN